MPRRRAKLLKRRGPQREPKYRFFIFSEGRNTEPAYFHALRDAQQSVLIHVDITGPAGVPLTLARAAVKKAKSLGLSRQEGETLNPDEEDDQVTLDSFEEGDQVWAVFDRDDHPGVNEAINLCEQARVGVGFSNPCFEVWLILHEEDYNRPDDRHAVQAHLQVLRTEYDKDRGKMPDCADMVTRVEEAEQRASRQLAARDAEGSPNGPPSTTVGNLTRAIRTAAERAR